MYHASNLPQYPKILVKSFREKTTSERKTPMPIRDVLQHIARCAIRSEILVKCGAVAGVLIFL
jgi:hypothetical protein